MMQFTAANQNKLKISRKCRLRAWVKGQPKHIALMWNYYCKKPQKRDLIRMKQLRRAMAVLKKKVSLRGHRLVTAEHPHWK